MMKYRYALVPVVLLGLSACTWVEVTSEGANVTLVKDFNVRDCLKLGSTRATVKHKIGIITRGDETVTEELISVARNRAAELGGDSIVAKGPANEGVMSFDIYKCGE